FASNNAHPHPSPHRSFLGNRPFESLTITNQILMSLVQVDCPVVSSSDPTLVMSFTSTAPSGNLPSRRYAWMSSGREYTLCISLTGLPGFDATAHVPRCRNFSRQSAGSEMPPSFVTYGEKSAALVADGGLAWAGGVSWAARAVSAEGCLGQPQVAPRSSASG